MKLHKIPFPFLILITFLGGWYSILKAEPGEGFALALGGGSFKPFDAYSGDDFKTSALTGAGYDYQWVLSDSLSFLINGTEYVGKLNEPGKTKYKYYKTGFLGLELRAWIGSWFIGYHGSQNYLLWAETLNSYTDIRWANGSGYGLGFETESGWMFSGYSEKSGTFDFDELTDQEVGGNRYLIGYRWR